MLQLADVCATTLFAAYEVNGWGFRTPCLAAALADHLYAHNGKVDTYGIKFFNDEMRPEGLDQLSCLSCIQK